MKSTSLDVEESGLVIGYEEYHPYGTTAYASGRSGAEVSGKRYRYTGKERDEETGLYYHGARLHAAWLARWTSADPAGMVDGPNVHRYTRGNPVKLTDPSGTDSNEIDKTLLRAAAAEYATTYFVEYMHMYHLDAAQYSALGRYFQKQLVDSRVQAPLA